MDIQGSSVLILGGSGLVGMAIARQLVAHRPARIVVAGLTRAEAETAVAELAGEAGPAGVALVPEWGDIFASRDLKDRTRGEVLADGRMRASLLEELYDLSVDEAARRSARCSCSTGRRWWSTASTPRRCSPTRTSSQRAAAARAGARRRVDRSRWSGTSPRSTCRS
jgi:NAD(P)-dependent dehydrogenase (short-subunit alcohol dehydrogenase family)